MAINAIVPVLLASLPLGIAHALDPDHLMTISVLSTRGASRRDGVRYAVQWALGHGGLLLLIATTTLLFHWALPPQLPAWAERLVGVILIGAGLAMLWAVLNQHHLAGDHGHAHGLSAPSIRRAPFAIGMVHGTAGSATMLAIIPMTFYRPAMGLVYVLVFSLGVLVGMMGFGFALGRVHGWLASAMPRLQSIVRGLIGLGAVGMGLFWLTTG